MERYVVQIQSIELVGNSGKTPLNVYSLCTDTKLMTQEQNENNIQQLLNHGESCLLMKDFEVSRKLLEIADRMSEEVFCKRTVKRFPTCFLLGRLFFEMAKAEFENASQASGTVCPAEYPASTRKRRIIKAKKKGKFNSNGCPSENAVEENLQAVYQAKARKYMNVRVCDSKSFKRFQEAYLICHSKVHSSGQSPETKNYWRMKKCALFHRIAKYKLAVGQLQQANYYFLAEMRLKEKLYNDSSPEVAEVYENIAICTRKMGIYCKALTFYQKAKDILEKNIAELTEEGTSGTTSREADLSAERETLIDWIANLDEQVAETNYRLNEKKSPEVQMKQQKKDTIPAKKPKLCKKTKIEKEEASTS